MCLLPPLPPLSGGPGAHPVRGADGVGRALQQFALRGPVHQADVQGQAGAHRAVRARGRVPVLPRALRPLPAAQRQGED
eukprot:143901-Prorocentrum_minimum.AAC.2